MIDYPDFQSKRVLVLGDVILDIYLWGQVNRISPEAPVPVVRVKQKTNVLGGAGNVALNLANLGCRPVLMGISGNDPAGAMLSEMLAAQGIDAHLFKSDLHPTTTKTRIIGQGQQLLRIDDEETWPVSPAVRQALAAQFGTWLSQVQVVILSDYGKGVLCDDLCRHVVSGCRQAGVPVFIDPKGIQWERYHGATCITPNFREFQLVMPEVEQTTESMGAAAADLIEQLQLDNLLVTLGAKGMSLFRPLEPALHIPTTAREVFDVSGAGDTVIATLAAAVAGGVSFADAARLANLAAGVVVGKLGTQPIEESELKAALGRQNSCAFGKVVSAAQARIMVSRWKSSGKRVVFTNGCFDLLHVGHLQLLNQAAEQGDALVVGLNSDGSVRRLKGADRPIIPQDERAAILAGLKSVDLVVLFEEDTPLSLIESLQPDVIVKGGDYQVEQVVGHDIVARWGGAVVIVPLRQGVSTSHLIQTVKSR